MVTKTPALRSVKRVAFKLPKFFAACALFAPCLLLNIVLMGYLDGVLDLMIEDWMF